MRRRVSFGFSNCHNGAENYPLPAQKNKLALAGLAIILLLAIIALFAPVLAPHHPYEQKLDQALMAPCKEYPFGTDHFGRCILSRIIFGNRTSLEIGVIVTAISAVAGIILGLLAGFYSGVITRS